MRWTGSEFLLPPPVAGGAQAPHRRLLACYGAFFSPLRLVALAQLAEKCCEVDGIYEALASQFGDFQIAAIHQFVKGGSTDRELLESFVDRVRSFKKAECARIRQLID